MNLSQIAAIVIFLAMFIIIIIGKVHRFIPALIGGALTIIIVFFLILRSSEGLVWVLNLKQLTEYHFWIPGALKIEAHGVNWQTIIFIGGMMVMVVGMETVGFFRWLCLIVAKMVNYQVIPILIAFMVLSGFLSMFIDSITVLLFLTTVIIELARLLKFDPVPMIIAAIFAANTGGAATMSGDPPNIIIGTAFGYTFMDFLKNTGPIAWASMGISVPLMYFFFRKQLTIKTSSNPSPPEPRYPEPREAIVDLFLFRINSAIFILVVILIVTHAETGLSLALIGVVAAFLTLLAATTRALHIVKRVDWRTLVFFIGLFVTVGGLEWTGVLKMVADTIGVASGGNLAVAIPMILWLSALFSAIVDNIPFAATMVPVIKSLSISEGFSLETLAWTLALSTDIGGNATPIGASANIVGTAIAEKAGYPISWGRFCRYAIPATIVVLLFCNLLLNLRYA